MKNHNGKIVLGLCCLLLITGAFNAEAAWNKKTAVGLVMMGTGAGLVAHAVNRFTFSDSTSEDLEAVTGLVLFGTGTVLLIWGLKERGGNDFSEQPAAQRGLEVSFGAAPTRKGFASAVRLRW